MHQPVLAPGLRRARRVPAVGPAAWRGRAPAPRLRDGHHRVPGRVGAPRLGGQPRHDRPRDVQWMTAASGVVHEEGHERAFTRRGGDLEMVQLWVNLPAKDKMSPPHYQEILDRQIPTVNLDGGGTARVIAGEFRGVKGPARTFTPVNVWDLRLKAGHRTEMTFPDGYTTFLLVLKGKAVMNDAEMAGEADLAVFDRAGDRVAIEVKEDTTLLVLSGEPINEPIASYGPFVMNTQDEIRQAIADFRSG